MLLDPPPPLTPTPMPLATYQAYWTDPITLYHVFDLPLDYTSAIPLAARVAATVFAMATPTVISYYFAIRVGMMAFLWMAGFVMKKIGRPIPDSPGVVMIREGAMGAISRGTGVKLPKIPSLGGRGRKGTWP